MTVTDRQKLRKLESDYLKMRWKINRYEKFVSMLTPDKHSEEFIHRTKQTLQGFRNLQDDVWEEIRSFY
ncbi:hypothetical protein [Escherichia phage vB_EcoP_PAS59]|uniref:Uncharacterized protein n=5 Tax=Suseptimavirus TaxID=3044836 RepID=A0AAE7XSV0_9CAUD|nr:hypothetical protein PQC41_gp075 [Escherichia phage vB_EcoP_SU7]YP_010672956.1 hypothetical protein PQC42_gp091 [Escherichia phage EK010]YP_010673105.1 hypothetical protein PQC43_gp078 [Escherichia phage vB_EcoP-101114UKE3]YP_010673243.1 hypothetical protein PQC44_gp071 [Escherichia phage IME267]EFV9058466.1 hypothetical protein [Shigella sonnei]UEN68456.1 hypothetical protein [Escherichia phage MLP3]USM81182.1 hypothetical protein 101114BS3_055 [Escherichia phage vB_EcoP-101114BS3]UYE899